MKSQDRDRFLLATLVSSVFGISLTFGPPQWRINPSFAFINTNLDQWLPATPTIMLGVILLAASVILVIGSLSLRSMVKLGAAAGMACFLMLALVNFWTCRPGGESHAGPGPGVLFLIAAYLHLRVAQISPHWRQHG